MGDEREDGESLAAFLGVLRGILVVPSVVPESSLMQFHNLSAARLSVAYKDITGWNAECNSVQFAITRER